MFVRKEVFEFSCQPESDWEKFAKLYKKKCDVLEALLEKYEELNALKDARIEKLLTMVHEFDTRRWPTVYFKDFFYLYPEKRDKGFRRPRVTQAGAFFPDCQDGTFFGSIFGLPR